MAWPVFFSAPRTGASGESVSPPTTGLQKCQKWSGVFRRKTTFLLSFFFLNEPIAGSLRHACIFIFTQIFGHLTAYGQYKVIFDAQS